MFEPIKSVQHHNSQIMCFTKLYSLYKFDMGQIIQ